MPLGKRRTDDIGKFRIDADTGEADKLEVMLIGDSARQLFFPDKVLLDQRLAKRNFFCLTNFKGAFKAILVNQLLGNEDFA